MRTLSGKVQPAWGVKVVIVTFLSLLIQVPPIIALYIRGAVGSEGVTLLWLVSLYFLTFVLIIAYAGYNYLVYRRWPSRHQNLISRLGWILGGYLVMFFGQFFLGNLNQFYYHQVTTANNQTLINLMGHQSLMIVLLSFSAIICSPIAEELIFRGVLMSFFFPQSAVWRPIILSGAVFTLEHASTTPVSYLIYFFIGGVLAFVYRKTGSLTNSIVLHALNNLVAVAFLFI